MIYFLAERLFFISKPDPDGLETRGQPTWIERGWIDEDYLRRQLGDRGVDILLIKRKLVENLECEI